MRRPVDPASEAVILAGAGRAILLQLAAAPVGHGVARHSDFARDPMGRLHGTLMYVYAVMAGTPDDRAVAVEYVTRKHRPVVGDGGDDHPAYDARDPQLQLWVAATLYDTAVRVYSRVLGNLPDPVADSLYRRYAALGTALEVPRGLWPSTRQAFDAYWKAAEQGLRVDATIRGQADALWQATEAPLWVRLLMPLNRFLTAGLLPAGVRDQYEMTWTARDQRRFDVLFAVIAVVYPRLPHRIRVWPERYYLRRLRRLTRSR